MCGKALRLDSLGHMDAWHCNSTDAATYPSVHIVGVPKAGTSFLFSLLVSHRQVLPANQFKEYCPNRVSYDKAKYFAGFRVANPGNLTANGCTESLSLHKCLAPYLQFHPKYILSLRNPAEWQWARYNFWTNSMDSQQDTPGQWTNANSYRSPELFHEIVLAGDKTIVSMYSQDIVRAWLLQIERFKQAVGSSNLLLLNADRLSLPETRQALAGFLGIDDSFRQAAGRVNSGYKLSSRGEYKVLDASAGAITGGVYEISGFRPMLNATTKLLNERNRESCCTLRHTYSIDLRCCD